MKYGQQLHEQSTPQWAPYNVDYDELKNLIKSQTTTSPGQARVIPGQHASVTREFEEGFFQELTSQHDRVELFVRSKADEFERRLDYLEKTVERFLSKPRPEYKPLSQKRQQRLAKHERSVKKCLDDTRALQHFVGAQQVGFHKILKKYKKWTGTSFLAERFSDEILGNIKGFLKRDFRPLLQQASDLLAQIRAATPVCTEPSTPVKESRKSSSGGRPSLTTRATSYWNEYDDGSDSEDTYAIYIDPTRIKEDKFPGAATLSSLLSYITFPIRRFAVLVNPSSTSEERRSLLDDPHGDHDYSTTHSTSDTDVEDAAACVDSRDYSSNYHHYPSFGEHQMNSYHERVLLQGMIGCFLASTVLLLVATILVATGKHRLRAEVDIGVVVGVIASLFFGTLGIATTMYRKDRLTWLHRCLVWLAFSAICIWDGMLLVFVVGNTRW